MGHRFLCFDVSAWSRQWRVRVFVLAVLFFWCIYSLVQEQLWKVEKFPYYWLLTCLQFFVYASLAFVDVRANARSWSTFCALFSRQNRNVLWRLVATVSLAAGALLVQRGLGNVSFKYLDYSTKLMLQSAKMLPVMGLGVVLLRKRYSGVHYFAAVLMTVGFATFSSAGRNINAGGGDELDGYWIGVALMVVVLLCEAVKPNLWKMMLDDARYKLDTQVLLLLVNSVGAVATLPVVFASGELTGGIALLADRPQLLVSIGALLTLGYCASLSSVSLVHDSSPMLTATVSSGRKLISIALSFVLFARPVHPNHIVGALIFFIGVGIQAYAKSATIAPTQDVVKKQ
jgi:solute carrier family 35 (adenosine 3'-phospho 5'-phosphosulfate transporter), member B3